jgi:hypothetical protein
MEIGLCPHLRIYPITRLEEIIEGGNGNKDSHVEAKVLATPSRDNLM